MREGGRRNGGGYVREKRKGMTCVSGGREEGDCMKLWKVKDYE